MGGGMGGNMGGGIGGGLGGGMKGMGGGGGGGGSGSGWKSLSGHTVHMRGLPYRSTESDIIEVSRPPRRYLDIRTVL